MAKKTMTGIKRNYSFRQYPDVYLKTMENAKACDMTIADIIDNAFDDFNKKFNQMKGGKDGKKL